MARNDISKAQKTVFTRSLSEQQAEAEAIFTSIGDGAISTDEFGKINRVNPRAQLILGYTASELIGEWFPKVITAVTAGDMTINLIDRPITKAFLTGQSISEKTFYRRKNGQIVPVFITVSPILVDDTPLGAIEVFRDITFEEEVDRMKSEFISLASHQLRTPLSAIKTYSHMLVDGYMGEITPAQKKSLKTIIGATNRMNELISTLLNITRIESGTIQVTPQMIELDVVTAELLEELAALATERSINLSFKSVGSASKSLETDPVILKEILNNLISNAVKYTPRGGDVTVKVQGRPKDVLITVSDTGWGIPKYSQSQIFSKFFRAGNIVKRETSGTGLGLYLVKGLVEALGGAISFKSSESKGTQFFLKLPRAIAKPKNTTNP